MFNVKDVRPILKAYQGKDIPVEYAKKEAEAKRVATEEWERRNPAGAGGGSAWLGGMFGGVAVSIMLLLAGLHPRDDVYGSKTHELNTYSQTHPKPINR